MLSQCTFQHNCRYISRQLSVLFVECENGFWGNECTKRSPCSASMCGGTSRGACVSTSASPGYKCQCLAGYGGVDCNTPICHGKLI